MQTTIGTEYRNGICRAFRNLRMSNPSIGHVANPWDVAASRSSWGAILAHCFVSRGRWRNLGSQQKRRKWTKSKQTNQQNRLSEVVLARWRSPASSGTFEIATQAFNTAAVSDGCTTRPARGKEQRFGKSRKCLRRMVFEAQNYCNHPWTARRYRWEGEKPTCTANMVFLKAQVSAPDTVGMPFPSRRTTAKVIFFATTRGTRSSRLCPVENTDK